MKDLYGDGTEEDENFYNAGFLQDYVDNDEISADEEGFMIGYLQ